MKILFQKSSDNTIKASATFSFLIFSVLFFCLSITSVSASIAEPRYGINEQTKECSEFFMGDECTTCTLPDDWQMIEGHDCPSGYNEIREDSVCTSNKTRFCCTVMHSGSDGACEDLVVNKNEGKCAFVDDINRCNGLPTNWQKAEAVEFWGSVCPSLEYEWLDETLTCEEKNTNNDLSKRLKGKILLQVEQNGEAWYVNPADEKRYFMGRPEDAFGLMRELGVGISNANLEKIAIAQENMSGGLDSDGDDLSDSFEDAIGTNKNSKDSDGDGYDDKTEISAGYNPNGNGKLNIDNSFATAQAGKILLQVERNGEAWYVNPENKLRYYLGRPTDAFNVMRKVGLGVTDSNLNQIQKDQRLSNTPLAVNENSAIKENNDITKDEPSIKIDDECSQYDKELQEICMTYKKSDDDYIAKLNEMEKELNDYRVFADKLYNCEDFSYNFNHPFTGENIRRGVAGLDEDGNCIQYEDVPSSGMMLCRYSEVKRKEASDYYKTQSPFDFDFDFTFTMSVDETTYENNGDESPLQEAIDNGTCTISRSNEDEIERILLKKEYLNSKDGFDSELQENITKKSFDSIYIDGNNEYVIDDKGVSFSYWDDYSVEELEENGIIIYQLQLDSDSINNGQAAIIIFDLSDDSEEMQDIIDEMFYQHLSDALSDYDLNMDYYYLETDYGRFFIYEDTSDNEYFEGGAVSMIDDNNIVVVLNDKLSKEEYIALVQSIKF